MGIPLLGDIIVIFGLSAAAVFVCNRLKIPSVVGFILTGVVAGPNGLSLISAPEEVEAIAEIGVVLLLFTIGMEFSLKDMARIKKPMFLGGSAQVAATTLGVFLAVRYLGFSTGFSDGQAVFAGFVVSLSSTAVVLKLLQNRAELDSPHGRTSLGILIFQDLAVVPMMLLTPFLAGTGGDAAGGLAVIAAKGVLIVLTVWVASKWIAPYVLLRIVRTRDRELFLLSIVLLCLASAWITSGAGLSLAIGAFLAGLIISESEYAHHALTSIIPFRDVFTSLFFVSIGMLFDPGFFVRHVGSIAAGTAGVLVLKTLVGGAATVVIGYPLRTAVLVGLSISQIGEFSFVLCKKWFAAGLLEQNAYHAFLSVTVLTMLASPPLMAAAHRLSGAAARLPLPGRLKTGFSDTSDGRLRGLKDHLVIIGYGLNGRNLARAAQFAGIPCMIIEMNPDVVRQERAGGVPILYGDAAHEAVLEHACIRDARAAVIAISDHVATRQITENVRKLSGSLYLVVRTRFFQDVKLLHSLGADVVIPEEYETSIEILSRVLRKYLVPRQETERFIAGLRSEGYEMLRSLSMRPHLSDDLKVHIPDVEISTVMVARGALAVGKTLSELGPRQNHGVTVLAIRRGGLTITNPGGDEKLLQGDILVLLGKTDDGSSHDGVFS
jgi:CPA2 family monovalent cation:H+ antiporter-2